MGRSWKSSREGRAHRRPDVERLEVRQLLSLTEPIPAASSTSSAFVRSDGSVDYDTIIQASLARNSYKVDGSGSNVAVIDTGVDAANPAFGGGTVGQTGNKVVAGIDFTGSPNGIIPTWQHGTGVAGLITSTNAVDPGVAPGAGIVALRVFGDDNQGSFDRIANALDWVVQNHDKYNITAVNLSVSDGGNYQSNQFGADGSAGQAITNAVQVLATENIPVVVAAGNNFDGKTQGLGFASIIPETISVTATDETKSSTKGLDVLAADAQRLGSAKGGTSATDLAAPGVGLIAPSGDTGTATDFGTSFATPQVTGTVVLLQEMFRKAYGNLPTVAQIDGWLEAGAVKVHDSLTGIDIGRLNVANSLGILNAQIQAQPRKPTPPVVPAAQVLDSASVVPPPVVTAQIVAAPVVLAPADPTPPAITRPTPLVESMTEVIVNGTSVGSVATARLPSQFARLLAMSQGSAKNLRAWAPAGSTVDLGAVKPSGRMVHPKTASNSSRRKVMTSTVTAAVFAPSLARASHRSRRVGRPSAAALE